MLPHADEVAVADAVDGLLPDVHEDARDEVDVLGDLGDVRIFATAVVAVAETRLHASLAAMPQTAAA